MEERKKLTRRLQPFSLASGAFFLLCGGGVAWYFSHEKARLARLRIREASKGVGKPRIGGPFSLIDQDGKRFTSEDLKGKFTLVRSWKTMAPPQPPTKKEAKVKKGTFPEREKD